jgi:uncharacterized membrane protein
MGLVLCNGYHTRIWTSIMFYSPDSCGPETDRFEMMGWWALDPGQCSTVYANDLGDVNRFWYFYAEASDGNFWAGPWTAHVTNEAFGGDQWCHAGLGSTAATRTIGYRELDVGDDDDASVTLVL